jgi:hypothetical protein
VSALIPLSGWLLAFAMAVAAVIAAAAAFAFGIALGALVRWWRLNGTGLVEDLGAAMWHEVGALEGAPEPGRREEVPAVHVIVMPARQVFRAPPMRPPAPARFIGWQDTMGTSMQPFELYVLTAAIPGYPEETSVSRKTLEAAGYFVPPAPYPFGAPVDGQGSLAGMTAEVSAGAPLFFPKKP